MNTRARDFDIDGLSCQDMTRSQEVEFREPLPLRRCGLIGCGSKTHSRRTLCDGHLYEAWSEFERATSPEHRQIAVEMLRRELKDGMKARRERNRAAGVGTIYYLRVGETIKVGFASDFERRLKQYPPIAEVLALEPGTKADEQALHQQFKPYLTHGREWYNPAPGLMAHIERVSAERGGVDARFTPRNGLPGPRPRNWPRHVA